MVKLNCKIKFFIILFGIILVMTLFEPFSNVSNATGAGDYWSWAERFKQSEPTTTTSDGIPDPTKYQPNINTNPVSKGILEKILSILQVIGVIGIVISVAMLGFKTVMGSASDKAVEQEKYGGILIATVMITSGISIAKFIISTLE